MKRIILFAAFVLFTISSNAQDAKSTTKSEPKKEKKCCANEADHKAMTAAEVSKCQAKCKAEGKKCTAAVTRKDEKKCCVKKA
ncbi:MULTISPECIES: hypothetical protein [unclassified Flavobacterium]|uniref:hypothetical protein n=1 Tax=unclassified Flavobacterium TaxID=196869 RepID=UPI003F93A3E1